MRELLESRLSEESGISRTELRQFRVERLEKGVHYVKGANGISYTKIGEKALKKYFPQIFQTAVEPDAVHAENFAEACGVYAEEETPPKKETPPPLMLTDGLDKAIVAAKEAPEIIELRVVSMPKNTRILYCEDSAGRMVLVHVRSNILFTQGMAVKARRFGGRVEYYGNYPRRKGVM